MGDRGGGVKALSMLDWEQIMQDFKTSVELQEKWLSNWSGISLLEQAIHSITKKEIPLKPQLFIFIEENADCLLRSDVSSGLGVILKSLRNVLSSPVDGSVITNSLRENMMVMATSVAVSTDSLRSGVGKLEGLVELFLGMINRTNHQSDRHVRGLACDCLRELEVAYPCLLHACVGHVHQLSLNERTHAGQSYTLLLTKILHNLSCHMYTLQSRSANYQPILQSSIPLIPFSVPSFLGSSSPGEEIQSIPPRELSHGNLTEFRKLVAFLLERPRLLTTVGMLEFVTNLIDIFKSLDLSSSPLKHQFSSLLFSYSPVLCHIVLMIHTQFLDSFDRHNASILQRLVLLSQESAQSLPFRLLGVHWLLGIEILYSRTQKKSILSSFASGLYPLVFDPLALKAAKLGAVAHCAIALHEDGKLVVKNDAFDVNEHRNEVDPSSKFLNEGLLAVSAYHWLPPWSTETQLAFHIFHKFITAGTPHRKGWLQNGNVDSYTTSVLFQTLLGIFVDIALKIRKLVPSLLALLDRLMMCDTHRTFGEKILQTYNEKLLPQLRPGLHLPSYFPVLERIAENSDIPPTAMIEKLAMYMQERVKENHGDGGSASWVRSSQVLGICRTVLLHHQSSRAFHVLAQLLGFLCSYFPDIEVRDTARLYLRMLISIPGHRLRKILKYGDERVEEANAPQLSHVSSLLRSPAPHTDQGHQSKPLPVASYVQLNRVVPLLVRHSWSLVLYNAFQASGKSQDVSNDGHNGRERNMERETVGLSEPCGDTTAADKIDSETLAACSLARLRVMDARTSEILIILRQHFSEIPDYLNGPGLKIKVQCTLRFQGKSWPRVSMEGAANELIESASYFSHTHIPDTWPAIYAVVIRFSTTGMYGPIPSVHVPFLLCEPSRNSWNKTPESSDEASKPFERDQGTVCKVDRKAKGKFAREWSHAHKSREDEQELRALLEERASQKGQPFCQNIMLELEPKNPVPALVDAHVVFSDEEGKNVSGQLDSIMVGIEDLFVKPPLPAEFLGHNQAEHLLLLFNALWDACGGPGSLGAETFSLKGGWEAVGIEGSESVKLLEAQADRVMEAVELYLAPFVVAVTGVTLVAIVKDGGVLEDVVWQEEQICQSGIGKETSEIGSPVSAENDELPLQIELRERGETSYGSDDSSRSGLGSFLVLIFLPPRFHLLLKMEVADQATLVRIRTDHWPCLAHVDEFLEALTMSR